MEETDGGGSRVKPSETKACGEGGGSDSGETLGQRTSKQHCVADGNCGLVGRRWLAEE